MRSLFSGSEASLSDKRLPIAAAFSSHCQHSRPSVTPPQQSRAEKGKRHVRISQRGMSGYLALVGNTVAPASWQPSLSPFRHVRFIRSYSARVRSATMASRRACCQRDSQHQREINWTVIVSGSTSTVQQRGCTHVQPRALVVVLGVVPLEVGRHAAEQILPTEVGYAVWRGKDRV